MEKLFDISHVVLIDHFLSFQVNGIPVTCDLARSSDVLARASADQVARIVVDPVGVGFHWPELDEDLSVSGILRDAGIQLTSKRAQLIKARQVV
ncbi:MAG: DUF2442 domain-containing protein [bacterium]